MKGIGAFENFLLLKYEAFTGATTLSSRPCYAMIDPCDVCQLRCPTCPTGIENTARRQHDGLVMADSLYRRDRSRMTPAMFDAVLDELGDTLFLIELHSWGEPLLNRNLEAFARRAKADGITVRLHTNLSLPLSDARIEDLVTCGIDELVASVDGFSQEVYEKFRVGGDVALVKDNLARLARARERAGSAMGIFYKFLLFRWNEHELEAAWRFADSVGIALLPQDSCVPDATWLPSRRADEPPFLSTDDVDDLGRRWAEAGHAAYWREHEKHPFWFPVEPGSRWIPPDPLAGAAHCAWHYSTTVVQPGGHLAPCCMPAKAEDRFGRIGPGGEPFSDVWNNPLFRKSRAAFAAQDPPELREQDSLCLRCHLPEPFRHVPSSNDVRVIAQARALADVRAELIQAFDLLEAAHDAAGRDAFVRHYRAHLAAPVHA